MPQASIPDAQGLWLNEAAAFSDALSATAAGSTHYLLRDSLYTVWATAPFAVYLTDAANDPIAVPTTLGGLSSWSGALVNTGHILLFQMDSSLPSTGAGTPTGARFFQLTGTAGVFYVTEFRRKAL